MLRELRAADHFVEGLEASAPTVCGKNGGGGEILKRLSGYACAAGFWSADFQQHESLWEALADEQQAKHRSSHGDE